MPNQEQKQVPQEEKKPEQKTPDFAPVKIEPVEDLLDELAKIKEAEHKRCGCWPGSGGL